MEIQYIQGTPVNRLLFAINYYLSTGDHVGEGVVYPLGNDTLVPLIYRRSSPVDKADFEKLQARLEELRRDGFPLDIMRTGDLPGNEGPRTFHAIGLRVANEDMEELARRLREKPGRLGWGSMKASIIDKYEWHEK